MKPLWIGLYVVVVVLLVFFIFLYYSATVTLVAPSQCGASYGPYSVTPGATAAPLTTCAQGTCTFVVETLQAAVEQCDDDSKVCVAFTYSEVNRNMTYVDPSAPVTSATLGGLYRRQVNPVVVSSGAS